MLKMLTALIALGLGGCIVHSHGPLRRPVIVETGHVHSEVCGHYYAGGHWYHQTGHVHRHGCGHALRGGLWISVD